MVLRKFKIASSNSRNSIRKSIFNLYKTWLKSLIWNRQSSSLFLRPHYLHQINILSTSRGLITYFVFNSPFPLLLLPHLTSRAQSVYSVDRQSRKCEPFSPVPSRQPSLPDIDKTCIFSRRERKREKISFSGNRNSSDGGQLRDGPVT